MARRESRMMALGTPAPDFSLPDTLNGHTVSLATLPANQPLLVAFVCNHCPYVKHIIRQFAAFANEYLSKGLSVVAISSNDVASHPEDSPAEMARLAKGLDFQFPYLYDETQAVARSYEAVCTPDFFLFDRQRRLAYRGQFDAARPQQPTPVTGVDLRMAADAVLDGKAPGASQLPSVGCNIKWKAGQEPDWA